MYNAKATQADQCKRYHITAITPPSN